mmetsp:Transcript_606/g.837  ORF Transcript_606/g.837 Transcript_606/m.837 type:complete len:205 (-) Transcript_606:212-826(-)
MNENNQMTKILLPLSTSSCLNRRRSLLDKFGPPKERQFLLVPLHVDLGERAVPLHLLRRQGLPALPDGLGQVPEADLAVGAAVLPALEVALLGVGSFLRRQLQAGGGVRVASVQDDALGVAADVLQRRRLLVREVLPLVVLSVGGNFLQDALPLLGEEDVVGREGTARHALLLLAALLALWLAALVLGGGVLVHLLPLLERSAG